MPLYLILAAAAAPSATTVVAALTSPSRRLRFRLVGADAGDLLTTPMTATISATFDGVASTEVVEFNRNGEFVSKNAFEILASPVVFADISGTPGTVEILEDIEPVLADAEDMVTACLFLREVADQFEKDAEPEDTDFWCRKGMKLLDTWIKANLKSDILDHPLGLRAGS